MEPRNDEGRQLLLPYTQSPDSSVTFAVRTAVDPKTLEAGIHRMVGEVDPELPVFDALTMRERIDDSLTSRRSPMLLSLCFGAVVAFGAGLGVLGSWILGRYLESALYGVRPLDPVVMALTALVLVAVALLATTLPAWRATRVDPIIGLRQQ